MNNERLFGLSKIGLGFLGTWYGLASLQNLGNDQTASLEYAVESGVFIAGAFGVRKLEKRFKKTRKKSYSYLMYLLQFLLLKKICDMRGKA
jgi:hypothetical protein